jgi:uncharacterized membrane protein
MTTINPAIETTSTTTTPPNVLAIAVSDRLRGQELLLAATRLGKRGSVELTDAAIVGVSRKGKPQIIQTRELNPSQGAMLGAWWGGLFGVFAFGIIGWLVGGALGAGLGWWRAHARDVGVPDDWMRGLVDSIYGNEVAVVFEMHNVYPTHLLAELRRFDGRLLTSSIEDTDQVDIEDALSFTI